LYLSSGFLQLKKKKRILDNLCFFSSFICSSFKCKLCIPVFYSGELPKEKINQEEKAWNWNSGDLPAKEIPESHLKPRGMDGCRYPVDFFIKMFGQSTFELLLEQSNNYLLEVSFRKWHLLDYCS
jgi:hypothetical protein